MSVIQSRLIEALERRSLFDATVTGATLEDWESDGPSHDADLNISIGVTIPVEEFTLNVKAVASSSGGSYALGSIYWVDDNGAAGQNVYEINFVNHFNGTYTVGARASIDASLSGGAGSLSASATMTDQTAAIGATVNYTSGDGKWQFGITVKYDDNGNLEAQGQIEFNY